MALCHDPMYLENVEPAFDGVPPYDPQDFEEAQKYFLSNFEFVENVEKYEPGGYHPVHLSEAYDNGRYKILHKLGYGGFSTVWLARDTYKKTYVALKFIVAEDSSTYRGLEALEDQAALASDRPTSGFFVYPLRKFWHDGPNGRHLCEVLPVLGPSISQISYAGLRLQPSIARRVALQATEALAHLHSKGLCHGDFTSANVLFQISSKFNTLTEQELYAQLGEPRRDDLESYSTEPLGPSAPTYVVDLPDFSRVPDILLEKEIRIIDFDQSFAMHNPPKTMLGTPRKYLAPEAMLDLRVGSESDIWALGCTIFKMRSGYDLFAEHGDGSPSNAIFKIVSVIGNLPDVWRHARFDDDGMPIRDDSNKLASDMCQRTYDYEPLAQPLSESIRFIVDEKKSTELTGNQVKINATSISGEQIQTEDTVNSPSKKSAFFWTPPSAVYLQTVRDIKKAIEDVKFNGVLDTISEDEALLLDDLLSKIFVYDFTKRPAAEEITKHPWFRYHESNE